MKIYAIAALVLLVGVMFAGCVSSEDNSSTIVGDDRDEHGCIGSAGYTWCEPKQKCLREWEESCDEETLEQKAQAYCDQENVGAVYVCGPYIKVMSTMPGSGTTFYEGGESLQCPIVAPDSMSDECRLLMLGNNCIDQEIC